MIYRLQKLLLGDNYGFRNDSQRYFWSKAATMMLKGEVYMWRGKHMGGGNEDYTNSEKCIAGSEKSNR